MRILIINVFYPPVAFGGATVVAEQTATLLARMPGNECLALCLDAVKPRRFSDLTRYSWNGVDVVATSALFDKEDANFRRSETARLNEDVIRGFQPDVALVHCIQDFGAEIIATLRRSGIPVALFVHDAWWICERQFMINAACGYCFQNSVDLQICRYCVQDINATRRRDRYLRDMIDQVQLKIFPSEFFRSLYVASGISERDSVVIGNGIVAAKSPGRSGFVGAHNVRFGFLGGLGLIKGASLLRTVFESLPRQDYELVCVDNTANVGIRSNEFKLWNCTGSMRIRDGFTQDRIDEFYNEIDVLLFPSQWKESFGLAVREALVRHKWVIVTDGGGTVEQVIDGLNGTIIPITLDPTALRQAVLDCFDRRWADYRNPHADKIRTFEEQAAELHSWLSLLVRKEAALPAA